MSQEQKHKTIQKQSHQQSHNNKQGCHSVRSSTIEKKFTQMQQKQEAYPQSNNLTHLSKKYYEEGTQQLDSALKSIIPSSYKPQQVTIPNCHKGQAVQKLSQQPCSCVRQNQKCACKPQQQVTVKCNRNNQMEELEKNVKDLKKTSSSILKKTTNQQQSYRHPAVNIPAHQEIKQKENIMDLDHEFNSMAKVLQQLESKKEQISMQKVVNMVKEEQDRTNQKLLKMREVYDKKCKAYEECHYQLGCQNSDLKARLELHEPQLKEQIKKIGLLEKQLRVQMEEMVGCNRRESEWKSESEMYKQMCSTMKVQVQSQESVIREGHKRQIEIRKEGEVILKEEQKRARVLDDRIIQMQNRENKLQQENENKNTKIEKMRQKLSEKQTIKEIEKIVTVEKKVEVPIYIDRPVIEHIHHPPERITQVKTVEVPVVVEQTPVIDQVIKTTVYQKEDQGSIISLENTVGMLKDQINQIQQHKQDLIHQNQSLQQQISGLQHSHENGGRMQDNIYHLESQNRELHGSIQEIKDRQLNKNQEVQGIMNELIHKNDSLENELMHLRQYRNGNIHHSNNHNHNYHHYQCQ